MEIVGLPRENTKDDPKAREIKAQAKKKGVYVHMESVDFAYEEGRWVYKNVDFMANPGEIVALIGPSGQGKTTAFKSFSWACIIPRKALFW